MSEPSFLTKLMSGADNTSPAIGRYLGALLFINFLTLIPAVVVGALLLQKSDWSVWAALFTSLTLYIPSVVGSIAALIRITNSTEPRPPGA